MIPPSVNSACHAHQPNPPDYYCACVNLIISHVDRTIGIEPVQMALLHSAAVGASCDSVSDEEPPSTYVIENVHYYRYMEVHFYFECHVSDNLYVQIRKCSNDNPPKSLAPHNYFEKITRNHHAYYGLDPAVLRQLPGNNSPYFKVIDVGPDFNRYGSYHSLTF